MKHSHKNSFADFTFRGSTKYSLSFIILAIVAISNFSYGQGWNYVGSRRFSAHEADYESIAIDRSGTPYVAYMDITTGKAVVKKFNGTDWALVGPTGGIDSFVGGYTQIAIDNSGTPYVSFVNGYDTEQTMVMKFDGTNWVVLGEPGFSVAGATMPSMSLDTAGMPYVAYLDDSGCFTLPTVKKWDGASWVQVGSPRFTTGNVQTLNIAVSGSTPYVIYADSNDSLKATVVKYNGSTWETVGVEGFSAGAVNDVSITTHNDTPYVSYSDNAFGGRTTVMKFNGTNWENVGEPGFSLGSAGQIALTFDNSGIPYIVYTDDSTVAYAATVKKFDGTNWVTVGLPGFAATGCGFNSIAIDPSGTPYVCYQAFDSSQQEIAVMKYYSTEGVNETIQKSENLTISPNPTRGLFNVNIATSTSDDAQITITNMLGEKVMEQKITTNKTTQLQLNVPAGVYFLSADTGDGRISGKIVVE